MDVSVLILTRNEEVNLARCLDSVEWSDDVLVLDSFSTDRTVEIARERGVRVMRRAFDDFATQRNHGIDEGGLRHGWVLHLDADEVVTPELRDEMERRLPDARVDAFRIPSKMIFQGQWLRFSGLYPSYQVRLGRRDRLRFRQVGHGQQEVGGIRLGTFESPLEHYSFARGLEEWFERHNRYSSDEARREVLAHESIEDGGTPLVELLRDPVARRRWIKRRVRHLPFRPTLRFLYMYVLRGGFLDGAAGFRYCRLLSIYESMIVMKVRELRRDGADVGD